MKIINKNGDVLEQIYTSHDRFLEDIDNYISEKFCFSVTIDDTIDLLDCVCGHLLY